MDLPLTATGEPSSSSPRPAHLPPNQAAATDRWPLLRELSNVPGFSDGAGKVVAWLWSKVASEYALLKGLDEEADKLGENLKWIQSLLADAEDGRCIKDESVKDCLLDLKFDADNVLDRYKTFLGVARLPREPPSRKRKRTWLSLPRFPSVGFGSSLLSRRSIGIDISGMNKRILARKSGPSSGGRTRDGGSRDSTPPPAVEYFDESQIVGRDEELMQIIDALKAESEAPLPVIPIYGDAGIGKTTLAQLVFKHFSSPKPHGHVRPGDDHHRLQSNGEGTSDEKGKQVLGQDVVSDDEHPLRSNGEETDLGRRPTLDEKGKKLWDHDLDGDDRHFEMKIWASLPKDCDVQRATEEIIEGITKQRSGPASFTNLQRQLCELVKDKKFLLVLDDFWAEGYVFWEKLRLPLLAGAKGSKVLITTRNEVVWSGMTTQCEVHLKGLSQSDGWKLLRGLAFRQSDTVSESLEELGKEIVSRCQGSPLAAKSLGIILHNDKNIENWESIRQEMCALEEANNPILPSLTISYRHLPFPLKQCFAYCSVFPDGHEFDKDELVKMWIAEGLIRYRGSSSTLETIGGRDFNHLLRRSFFEISSKHEEKYRMPSMIHDLARQVSKNELLIMDDNDLRVPSQQPRTRQPRYAFSFHRNHNPVSFEKLYEYGHLRTLRLSGESGIRSRQVLEGLFCKLKFLRLLDLSNSDIEMLPDSVGNLLHIRYLGLTNTKIAELPESVAKLYNLQTLELSECRELLALPEGTSKLVNLRHLGLHLDWDNFNDLSHMPPRIDYLTSLQTLSRFTVNGEGEGNIRELKNLNLRGELCICKLENIIDSSNAKAANLIEKRYIKKLMLRWSDYTSDDTSADPQQGVETYEEVAKELRPHTNLECLRILNYYGRTFPDWLGHESFTYLETLMLSRCENCGTFPSLWRLPRLKNLHTERMNRLESLGDVACFPSLETLTLIDMPKLQKLFDVEAGEIRSLRKLFIFRCPRLIELIKLPLRTEVVIEECRLLRIHSVPPTCFFG